MKAFLPFLCLLGCFVAMTLSPSLRATDPQVKITVTIQGKNLADWEHPKMSTGKMVVPSATRLDLGYALVKPGASGSANSLWAFPYPNKFDPPQMVNANSAALVPPQEFSTQNLGWDIELSPSLADGLIRLQATATYTTLGAMKDSSVYGEWPGPVYSTYTDPKTGEKQRFQLIPHSTALPSFQTVVTPFFVFAKPGKEYTVKLRYGSGWVDATIKCELM